MEISALSSPEGWVRIFWRVHTNLDGCIIIYVWDRTAKQEWIRTSRKMAADASGVLKMKIPIPCLSHRLTVSVKAVVEYRTSVQRYYNVSEEATCDVTRVSDFGAHLSTDRTFNFIQLSVCSQVEEWNVVNAWHQSTALLEGREFKQDRRADHVTKKDTESPTQTTTMAAFYLSTALFKIHTKKFGNNLDGKKSYDCQFPPSQMMNGTCSRRLSLNIDMDRRGKLTTWAVDLDPDKGSAVADKSDSTISFLSGNLQISVTRSNFAQASVILTSTTAHLPDWWLVTLTRKSPTTSTKIFLIPGSLNKFEFPLQFQATHKYSVSVKGLKVVNMQNNDYYQEYRVSSSSATRHFRSELTKAEIDQLYQRTVQHALPKSVPCIWLYRNKPDEYFRKIFENFNGKMEVYDKDASGDPASPINLQIKGLFFLASVENGSTTGQPKTESQFGDTRLLVPVEEIMALTPKVYFADYYCMLGQSHYATLVMTKSGSKVDRYCEPRLKKLDLNNNPIFFYKPSTKSWFVSATEDLLVELLYTEDIDVKDFCRNRRATIEIDTPLIGKGSSTVGGRPKNPNCFICNLYYPSRYPDDQNTDHKRF